MATTKEKQSVTRVEFDLSDDTKAFLTALFNSSNTVNEQTVIKESYPVKQKKDKTTEVTENHDEPEVSLTQIREMIQEKAEEGKTDKIKQLLSKHSAKSASTLSAENYKSFFAQLSKL